MLQPIKMLSPSIYSNGLLMVHRNSAMRGTNRQRKLCWVGRCAAPSLITLGLRNSFYTARAIEEHSIAMQLAIGCYNRSTQEKLLQETEVNLTNFQRIMEADETAAASHTYR